MNVSGTFFLNHIDNDYQYRQYDRFSSKESVLFLMLFLEERKIVYVVKY